MALNWKPQVYLVGAGPGDPGLLTRRGERALRRADVILYDFLTNPALLEMARPEAERVYVGKRAGEGRPDQEGINARLIAEARKGRIVVRLKGGDGFVFGRGGEEALALREAGVRFEVVPGVSSAIAAPAMAGIPVTHRSLSAALHILTGYEDPDSPGCAAPWDLLARSDNTIVILMGASNIGPILRRLARAGKPRETPLAVVRWGSYARQESLRSTLGAALDNEAGVHLAPPSITIVGAVAGMDEGLNWFERRPLFGRRVALARPEESGEAIAEALSEAGADVESHPAIRLETLDGAAEEFERGLARAREEKGWLILPSSAAMRHMFAALGGRGLDARALAGVRVAVLSPRGAEALAARGVRADFVSPSASGAALAAALPIGESEIAIIAGSSQSRPELAEGLRARGAEAIHSRLYAPVADAEGLAALRERLEAGWPEAVVVFSPSQAEAIAAALAKFLPRPVWFAIGATTARAMERLGFALAGVAAEPSADGLIEALAAADARRAKASPTEAAR